MSEDEATQDDTSSGSGSDSNNETHSISHQMKALLHDKRGVVVDVHIFSNEKRVNKSGRDSDEGEPFSVSSFIIYLLHINTTGCTYLTIL